MHTKLRVVNSYKIDVPGYGVAAVEDEILHVQYRSSRLQIGSYFMAPKFGGKICMRQPP